MGPSKPGCRRLHRIGAQRWLKHGCLAALALLLLAGHAWAQITPLHGTLEYSAASGAWPDLTVKAANGSPAYMVTLWPLKDIKGNLTHIDLVLYRPNTRPDASNLLEPAGRWHGLQPYDFNAIDFKNGPEKSLYGKTRTIVIKNRKLNVTFSISTVGLTEVVDPPAETSAYAFTEFAVDVDIENLK